MKLRLPFSPSSGCHDRYKFRSSKYRYLARVTTCRKLLRLTDDIDERSQPTGSYYVTLHSKPANKIWNLERRTEEAWSPLTNLLLPSVVCTRDDSEAEIFLSARVYSLFFFMLLQGLPSALRSFQSPPGAFHLLRAEALARALANTTLDTLPLYSPPSAGQVLRMQCKQQTCQAICLC
eukprot:g61853.t1